MWDSGISMPPRVQIDAARTDRSLVRDLPQRMPDKADPVLLLWRRLIDTAVADATKTMYGVPTHSAILARWWIEEYKPAKTDKQAWCGSFECACSWLGKDPAEERKLLSGQIQARLRKSAWQFAQSVGYVRRAEVLACIGRPTAIARQFVMALVSVDEYKVIAGIDEPEKQPRLFDRVDRKRKRAA